MRLLTQEQLDDARRELENGRLSNPLWEFLYHIVFELSHRKLLPRSLSPTGRWDRDAVDEVMQGWLTDQLVTGGLAKAFHRVEDALGLSRFLERSLRNWLISAARKRAAPRLLQRTRALLRDSNEFTVVVSATSPWSEWWGLAEWSDASPYSGTDRDLVSQAYALGDFSILRYRSSSARSDPILSSEDLKLFVFGLFRSVGQLLTLRHLSAVFEHRFAFAYTSADVSLDVLQEETGVDQPDELQAEEEALRVLGSLTNREVQILALRYDVGLTLEEAAARLGIAKSTVHNGERVALQTIREHSCNEREARIIMEKLLEMAFQGRDQ